MATTCRHLTWLPVNEPTPLYKTIVNLFGGRYPLLGGDSVFVLFKMSWFIGGFLTFAITLFTFAV